MMPMRMRVTYSVGNDPQRITEVIEVTNWGTGGAMHTLREMYPNKQITLHSSEEIH